MKLANRLESKLNRLFIATASIGFVVLCVSTYISVVQVKEKAANFMVSHLKQISVAEIYSQNVSDIDKEIGRLAEAWQGTQDIEMRADIYLDDKLVGHAGQLQKFTSMSSSISKAYDLPSGQKLKIDIELDLTNQIIFDLLVLLVFMAFFAACFYLVRRSLSKMIQEVTAPIEKRVAWLSEVSSRLPQSIQAEHNFEEATIDEVRNLDTSLLAFTKQIKLLEERVSKSSFDLGRLKMAELLAHNIRGPLASLQMRINNAAGLDEPEKYRLIEGVNNILDSSKALLTARKQDQDLPVEQLNTAKNHNLKFSLIKIIEERQETIPRHKQIEIRFDSDSGDGANVPVAQHELESMLRNLLDNAIESIESVGHIQVSLKTAPNSAQVKIIDNGCGIPEEVRPLLMTEGATFGKPNGTGLGLSHAKSTMLVLNGSIDVSSEQGKGTTVALDFPLNIKTPSVPTIDLIEGQTLVILDDDKLVHDCWSLKVGTNPKFNRVDLFSIGEFEKWMTENGPGEFGSRVYLMDYDLKNERTSGIDLVTKYDISMESHVITGMANSCKVIDAAKKIKVPLFSKEFLHEFKLNVIENSDGNQITDSSRNV